MNKTKAIQLFLQNETLPELASKYSHEMEVQVNVARGEGERIEGEYLGHKWQGWTDHLTTWKPIRIPYKAMSEPEYTDTEIRFDLSVHAEGIGLTGWNWVLECSEWVAFDFDDIISHKQGLTDIEIKEIIDAVSDIPWVELRKSTSGNGLHIYVYLNPNVTVNHTEHAALARAVLGQLAALTSIDFQSKVDACGGILWVWHRKMAGTDGLTLMKESTEQIDPPINWRDHLEVVKGNRRKNAPSVIKNKTAFADLYGQLTKAALEEPHKALIAWLDTNECVWWWDSDHHMLVTHTSHLADAFTALSFKGIFRTNSSHSSAHNCFLFPIRKGAWVVRRYGMGVQEDISWDQDGQGWTRCFYNREPDFITTCKAFEGIEDPSGGFVFLDTNSAAAAAKMMGVFFEVGMRQQGRETKLKQAKDGRLVIEVEGDKNDRIEDMGTWLRKPKVWTKVAKPQISPSTELEMGNYDDFIRHIVEQTGSDAGWMIHTDETWKGEPLVHIRAALAAEGLNSHEVTSIIGNAIKRPWSLVNKPFQSEYPGDREWNFNAAQFRFHPTQEEELNYPNWLRILDHCGENLDGPVKENAWCQNAGILTGSDYLKCWIASIFQQPTEPLPYLFFYGPENSGKSIFHEALSLLVTKGYQRADQALTSSSNFNGELDGAIICVVEEVNLGTNKIAHNRIKDWVTGRELLIRPMYHAPYHTKNTTHWVQCANHHSYCPVFRGDTRIVIIFVDDLTEEISKRTLLSLLEKEASDFLAAIQRLELPEATGRLNLPTITSAHKEALQGMNRNEVEIFLEEQCSYAPGMATKYGDLFDLFLATSDATAELNWTKRKFGKELNPEKYPKGRGKDSSHYIGNIIPKGTAHSCNVSKIGEKSLIPVNGFLKSKV